MIFGLIKFTFKSVISQNVIKKYLETILCHEGIMFDELHYVLFGKDKNRSKVCEERQDFR